MGMCIQSSDSRGAYVMLANATQGTDIYINSTYYDDSLCEVPTGETGISAPFSTVCDNGKKAFLLQGTLSFPSDGIVTATYV